MIRTNHWCDGFGGLRGIAIEECTMAECGWPRKGTQVIFPVDGRKLLCKVTHRGDLTVTVEVPGGETRIGPLHWAEKAPWGTYCPHGKQVVEAVPAAHICHLPKVPCDSSGDPWHVCADHQPACAACYPTGRKVRPWACDRNECSEKAFDEAEQAAMDAYYEEQLDAMRWAQGH